jgi:nitroreductase
MEAVVSSVRKVLNIPESVFPLGIVYIGYPAEEKAPGTKFDQNRVHWQIYELNKPRLKLKNAKYQTP